MTLQVRSGGSWVGATPYVKRAGSWVAAAEVWVKRAGAWVQAYTAGSLLTGASLTFTGGPGPFNVSGANNTGGAGSPGFVQSSYTGGYPPVTSTVSVVGGGGKIGLFDTGQGDGALGWSGLALGEMQTFYFSVTATDSHGTTKTARYPVTGTISVTRTS